MTAAARDGALRALAQPYFRRCRASTIARARSQLKEALLAALWERERAGEGGRGCYIDVSLLAAGVSSLANQATAFLRRGVVPQRMGSDHPSICP